jgi:nucleotide-binding universal stress UspA family protein
LLKKNVPVEIRLESGTPYRETLNVVRKEKVHLIVMGTHGRTGMEHLLMGSVEGKVVRLADCLN